MTAMDGTKKKTAKSSGTKTKAARKCAQIDTGRDKRFVRRRSDGQFKEVANLRREKS
jgi:hypothetical protein